MTGERPDCQEEKEEISTMDKYTEPQWNRSAVLTIDVQRDFCHPSGACYFDGAAEAIRFMERVVRAYRDAGLPIVHVVRLYLPDGSNADSCRKERIENGLKMVIPDTEGSQVAEALLPDDSVLLDPRRLLAGEMEQIGPSEWIMYKPRWGAFFKTPLEEHLHRLGVTTTVFTGLNFPNCPRSSIYQATERDFRVVAISDAISGIYDRGLDELNGIGAVLLTTDQCLDAARSATAPDPTD